MYNLQKFKKSDWDLIVYKNKKIIFRSKDSGIKPLIKYVKKFDRKYKNLVVYDKIVGRAAALLLAYTNSSKVYTPIISHSGILVLKKYKIDFEAKKKVKYIMNYGSKDICKWEKLAKNKTPAVFWKLVKNL